VYDYPGFNINSNSKTIKGVIFLNASNTSQIISYNNELRAEIPELIPSSGNTINNATVTNSIVINSVIENANVDNGVIVNSIVYAAQSSAEEQVNKYVNDGWNTACGPWASKFIIRTGSFLNPGDKVLFRRGDILQNDQGNRLRKTGTIEKPIYFGAYGTGAKPIINGTSAGHTFFINNYGQPMIGLVFDGLHLIGSETVGIMGFRIEGDSAHDNDPAHYAANGYCDHITIQNMEIENFDVGIQSGASYLTVTDNIIHHNMGQGMLGGGAHVLIARNKVYSNGHKCSRTPRVHCHNLYVGHEDVQILDNEIYDGDNYGIVMHGFQNNILIRGNDIYNNWNGIATDHYNSDGLLTNILIEKNKIHNNLNGWTLSIGAVQNYTFRNNLVYNNPNGFFEIRNDDPGIKPNDGVYIYGNTFYNLSSLFNGGAPTSNAAALNNIIVCTSGSSCLGNAYNLLTNTSGNAFLSLSSAGSYFVNPGAGDFHLKSSAVNAIDKGTDLNILQQYGADISAGFKDYDEITRPQGSGWDVGAYEYVSGTPQGTCVLTGARWEIV
ncbi:MAG: right-handed parallel beta-helix repeat-containing protein, partial [archaeon]